MIDKIYNEDCIEGMKRIPDGSVDLICTDPPYCVGVTSNGIKGSFLDNNLIAPFFKELFKQWQRVLKGGGHIYMHTDWRTYPFLYPIINQYFIQRNLIIWKKGTWIAAGAWYRFQHELIIFATKGKCKREFPASERDIFDIPLAEAYTTSRVHQSQKPVALIEKMIKNSSHENEIVLDCFMGSGTTAVACINTNRHFIGFELEEKFCEIANERIAKARAAKSQELF